MNLVTIAAFFGLLAPGLSILDKDSLFQMVWQAPHHLCQKDPTQPSKYPFPLEEDGFLVNPRGQGDGEETAIFYKYGSFPMYAFSDPDRVGNGGIPQRGNLEAHLQKAKAAIEDEVPNEDFDGCAVLNQEEWRPLFAQNFGVKHIYQAESLEFARDRETHPELFYEDPPGSGNWKLTSDQALLDTAIEEFDQASLNWSVDSLLFARELRPFGKWGYYAFPYCYNSAPPVAEQCTEQTRERNDRQKPIWDAASAIYPSLYVWNREYTPEDRGNFAAAQTEEGIRVASLAEEDTPVYTYTRMLYTTNRGEPRWAPYRPHDLWTTMRMAAEFGADGLIMWGANVEFEEDHLCFESSRYYNNYVGPYARRIMKWAADCSEELCSGNGKCIHRGALDLQYRHEMIKGKNWDEKKDPFDLRMDFWSFPFYDRNDVPLYKCKCLDLWTGDSCSERGPTFEEELLYLLQKLPKMNALRKRIRRAAKELATKVYRNRSKTARNNRWLEIYNDIMENKHAFVDMVRATIPMGTTVKSEIPMRQLEDLIGSDDGHNKFIDFLGKFSEKMELPKLNGKKVKI